MLDVSRLTEQLLGFVARGTKIDHLPGDHDDLANAAAGAVSLCASVIPITADAFARGVISFFGRPNEERTLWGRFNDEHQETLLILELVAAGQMPLDEARRRLAEILRRSRRPSRVLNWPLKSAHHTTLGMLMAVVGFPRWPTRRRIRGLRIKPWRSRISQTVERAGQAPSGWRPESNAKSFFAPQEGWRSRAYMSACTTSSGVWVDPAVIKTILHHLEKNTAETPATRLATGRTRTTPSDPSGLTDQARFS